MAAETTFTSNDLERLAETRSLMKALRSLSSKPGNNKLVAALGEIIGLVDEKLQALHDDFKRRLREATA